MQHVCPIDLLFIKYTRFCIRSVRKNVNEKEGFILTYKLSTSSYTLQWKVWLKEVLTITENNIKMAPGYYLV